MVEEFLEKLAILCDEYNAQFDYTTDDDGIHINVEGKEVFIGFLDESASRELRNYINKR